MASHPAVETFGTDRACVILKPENTADELPVKERVVTVVAPARLHLGFVDLHGGLERIFGSLGLAIDEVATRISVTRADRQTASGPDGDRAADYAESVMRGLDLRGNVAVNVIESIPEHAGLGSGTQLGLAVGLAIARLFEHDIGMTQLAALVERGRRSGIGIGTFAHGGFIVDGGRGPGSAVPPVVSRLPFPCEWRVVLILDEARSGLHGSGERTAFAALPPMSEAVSGMLCRRLLMQILPAIVERDFAAFCAGIGHVQDTMSGHFATAQGGRYTSPLVGEVLGWFRSEGMEGIGQSSWGPTGFAFCADERAATAVMDDVRRRWTGSSLRVVVASAANAGATVQIGERRQAEPALPQLSEV